VSDRRRTAARWAAVGSLVVVAVLLSLSVGVRLVVDAEAVERRLSALLSEPGRPAVVNVGRAEARLLSRSLGLEDVSVQRPAGDEAGARGLTVHLERGEIEGAAMLPLVLDGRLDADAIRLERLTAVATAPVVSGEGSERAGAPADSARGGAGPLGDVPPLSAGRLEVEDARLALRSPPAERADGWEDGHLLDGLTLRLADVSVGGRPEGEGARIRLGGVGEAGLERYRGSVDGGLHGVEVRGVSASLGGDSVRIDALRLLPLPDEEGFLRRLTHRKDRFQVVAGAVRARGVDVGRAMRGAGLLARRIDVGSFALAVHTDRRLPRRPGRARPAMPPALLRDAGVPVEVDTVRMTNGRVEYSERTADASRPGRVSFEEIDATFLHVANDTTGEESSGTALVRTTSRLYGAGRLRADFRFRVLSPDLDFSLAGELGEMDLRSLNDMFVPVAGIRLSSGRLERLAFDARVRDGRAAGSVRGRYRDLDVEKVDPASGRQSLPDVVASLVMDAEIRASNPPSDDGEARTGTIEHLRAPADPFFHFLWASLRSGLLSLVGA
jgi:hypothetical protein